MKQRKKILFTTLIIMAISIQSGLAAGWEIKKGEKLSYKIAFSSMLTGSVKGGEASLSVSPSTSKVSDNNAYHATLKGGTTGFIERIYRIENLYETFMNTSTLAPYMYRQSVVENKYRSADTVYFNQNIREATYKGKQIKIPNNTHDFVSMIYYVRSIDVDKLQQGDSFEIPFFTSDKVINSKVVYNGVETIRVNNKEVQCHAYKPQVAKGKMFNHDYPATIWISTDEDRLPMLIEARMKVGRVKMELLHKE